MAAAVGPPQAVFSRSLNRALIRGSADTRSNRQVLATLAETEAQERRSSEASWSMWRVVESWPPPPSRPPPESSPPPSRRPARGGDRVGRAECDMVQFNAPIYYAEEAEGVVCIEVMRMGSLIGAASVRWQTVDGCAKAGVKFKAAAGLINFHEGEHIKSFEVALIQNETWSTTLEFNITLSECQNCEVDSNFRTARVKIIDSSTFPTSKYAEMVVKGPESIARIPKQNLMLEFLKMNLQIPGVVWRTALHLVLDQMVNIYFYFTLNVTKYITDVLFDDDPGSVSLLPGLYTSMLVPDSIEGSAWCLAALYILPMVLLHAWDYASISVDLKGKLRMSLKASLYRKYLNYIEDSKKMVRESEVRTAIMVDVAEASQCYTRCIELARIFFKLLIIISFTLQGMPHSWWILLLMPTLMASWIYLRSPIYLRACEDEDDIRLDILKYIQMTCDCYELAVEYRQRPMMCESFTGLLQQVAWRGRIPREQIELNNKYFPKWLGPIFAALYLCVATKQVLIGNISVGTFLMTMHAIRSIATDFGDAYLVIMSLKVTIGSLRDLVYLFNMPIELHCRRDAQNYNIDMTRRARENGSALSPVAEDAIPLEIVNMAYTFSGGARFMSKVSLIVPQGSMIAVMRGSAAKGRATFLKLLGQTIFPTQGHVFIPAHLRVLHVSYQPVTLNLGLWANLTFGEQDARRDRVMSILSDLHMRDTLHYLAEHQDDSVIWREMLSLSELALVHLVRAFVMSPEVTVFQRPLAHFIDRYTRKLVLGMLEDLVDTRGVRLPAETQHKRRPRTCFYSPETESDAEHADTIWELQSDRSISVRGGRGHRKRYAVASGSSSSRP